jgi:hypothetical protein
MGSRKLDDGPGVGAPSACWSKYGREPAGHHPVVNDATGACNSDEPRWRPPRRRVVDANAIEGVNRLGAVCDAGVVDRADRCGWAGPTRAVLPRARAARCFAYPMGASANRALVGPSSQGRTGIEQASEAGGAPWAQPAVQLWQRPEVQEVLRCPRAATGLRARATGCIGRRAGRQPPTHRRARCRTFRHT